MKKALMVVGILAIGCMLMMSTQAQATVAVTTWDLTAGQTIKVGTVTVSNDAANRNLARVVVVPLTSNTGRQYPGEAVVTVGGQSSKAMADQITTVSKERLFRRAAVLSPEDLNKVEEAVKIQLALN